MFAKPTISSRARQIGAARSAWGESARTGARRSCDFGEREIRSSGRRRSALPVDDGWRAMQGRFHTEGQFADQGEAGSSGIGAMGGMQCLRRSSLEVRLRLLDS